MPTLIQVRDKANAKLAEIWPVIQSKQASFFAQKGRYFQLLYSTLPVDGADTAFAPRLRTDLPWMQNVNLNWSDIIPFQIEVHEWNDGYRGIVTIYFNGQIYQRVREHTNADTGWFQLAVGNDPRYGIS